MARSLGDSGVPGMRVMCRTACEGCHEIRFAVEIKIIVLPALSAQFVQPIVAGVVTHDDADGFGLVFELGQFIEQNFGVNRAT